VRELGHNTDGQTQMHTRTRTTLTRTIAPSHPRTLAPSHPPHPRAPAHAHARTHTHMRRTDAKALEFFKAAAERGNAEAQFNLGAMYIGGMGVRKAHEKALHYFTLSAHQGHTLALYNLGQMHLNGLSAPRSCPVGVQFLKAVAERGPWSAMFEEAHAALQSGGPEVPDAAPASPSLLLP
jgi:TPR repeat protein